MKNGVIVFMFLLVARGANAQVSALPNNIRAGNTLERLYDSDGLGRSDLLYGVPMPPGEVIGDTYYTTTWHRSAVLLYAGDKMLEGYPTRYDIYNRELELKSIRGIKVLKAEKVKSFVLVDSLTKQPMYFINSRDFTTDNTTLEGFFEVSADGVMPLLRRTNIVIKKADYKVQFDMGSRDDKILKKDVYYYAKGNTVYEVPGSKKKLLPLFGEKATEMDHFIDERGLNVSRDADLITIFTKYNDLAKTL